MEYCRTDKDLKRIAIEYGVSVDDVYFLDANVASESGKRTGDQAGIGSDEEEETNLLIEGLSNDIAVMHIFNKLDDRTLISARIVNSLWFRTAAEYVEHASEVLTSILMYDLVLLKRHTRLRTLILGESVPVISSGQIEAMPASLRIIRCQKFFRGHTPQIGMEALRQLTQLTGLSFAVRPEVWGIKFGMFTGLENIRELTLDLLPVSIFLDTRLLELRHLGMAPPPFTLSHITKFSGSASSLAVKITDGMLPNLRYCKILSNPYAEGAVNSLLNSADYARITKLPLRELDGSWPGLMGDSAETSRKFFQHATNLTQLATLRLYDCYLAEDTEAECLYLNVQLAAITSLTELALSYDNSFVPMQGHRKLRKLHLQSTDKSVDGAPVYSYSRLRPEVFSQFPYLRELVIDNVAIENQELFFSGLTNLTSLAVNVFDRLLATDLNLGFSVETLIGLRAPLRALHVLYPRRKLDTHVPLPFVFYHNDELVGRLGANFFQENWPTLVQLNGISLNPAPIGAQRAFLTAHFTTV